MTTMTTVANANRRAGFQGADAGSSSAGSLAPMRFGRARQLNDGFLSPVHYLIRLRQRRRSETGPGARDGFVTNS